ncbi:DNA-deoxyinosine glycosylase [Clostridia bacterium OttesenSCG-928-F22]|nr:DNA-deoxyinosine glycosylase [Clostridia bacterium OttesenSCG-928-F22]
MDAVHSFAPLFHKQCTVLILGTAPSPRSLQTQQAYGHPRNHFWRLMTLVLGEEYQEDYGKRREMLLRHNIALWDVCFSCQRKGALDKDITDVIPNDIPALLNSSNISLIAFNGTKAQQLFKKHFPQITTQTLLLPSSSPVPRKGMVTLEDKLPRWQALQAYL